MGFSRSGTREVIAQGPQSGSLRAVTGQVYCPPAKDCPPNMVCATGMPRCHKVALDFELPPEGGTLSPSYDRTPISDWAKREAEEMTPMQVKQSYSGEAKVASEASGGSGYITAPSQGSGKLELVLGIAAAMIGAGAAAYVLTKRKRR